MPVFGRGDGVKETNMGKLKDTIFNEIRSDYVINKSDSFLYKYLLEGKMKDKCKGGGQSKAG